MFVLRNSGSLTDDEEETEATRPLRALIGVVQEREAKEEAEQQADAVTTATTAAGHRWGDTTDTPPTPGPGCTARATTKREEAAQTGHDRAVTEDNPFVPRNKRAQAGGTGCDDPGFVPDWSPSREEHRAAIEEDTADDPIETAMINAERALEEARNSLAQLRAAADIHRKTSGHRRDATGTDACAGRTGTSTPATDPNPFGALIGTPSSIGYRHRRTSATGTPARVGLDTTSQKPSARARMRRHTARSGW